MVPKRAHRFLQWKMSCCYCCSTQYLIGGWRSLAHPTTTSLLGPSWLAGGGLGAIVNIRGRGPAGLSTAVWGSRVRGCIGGILRPLLITEDKKDKKCKWIISRKTTTTTPPKSTVIYHTLNVLGHSPQINLALVSILFSLFLSFIIAEFQLGGVIYLLMSSCFSKTTKNKMEAIRTMFVPNIHSVTLFSNHH